MLTQTLVVWLTGQCVLSRGSYESTIKHLLEEAIEELSFQMEVPLEGNHEHQPIFVLVGMRQCST